ncbi:hypothetical protein GE061_014933 [Apolygus lucorum]|uniref:Growth factor receptor domain-containing protein n=1 Tax=Apolygus lucorum TaxID=248454 RepID=A0A6A4J0L9_APOLU|nr:hypothetical protein GE061_014933 [Apolygus lucorum]
MSIYGIFIKWQLYFHGTDTKPVNLRPPSLQLYRNNQDKITETNFFKPKTVGEMGYDDNSVDEGSEVVYNCHAECDSKGCYGPDDTQCISCSNYRMNKSCVASCLEEGYYPADGECKKCHPDCVSCTGPGYHSCLTCAPHLYYIMDLAICMHSCPHTYYQDVVSKRCISCHETCVSCDKGPNVCSSCESHLFLFNGSCYATCPPGTFTNRHQRCSSCHPSCEDCTGSRPNDCIIHHRELSICSSGGCTHCPPGLLLMNMTCVSACGTGWYQSGNICRRCWQGCASCYGGRKDECISCMPGKTLARGQCRLHCPRNMYSTANGCANCHHFCSTCNGGGAYACTTCSPTRYLDETTGLCYACHSSCYGCTSASETSCTSCRQDLFLDNGQCVKSYSKSQNYLNQVDVPGNSKLHSSSAGKRRISEMDSELWEPLLEEPMQEYHRSKPPEYSPFVTVTVIAVVAQMRSGHRRHKGMVLLR